MGSLNDRVSAAERRLSDDQEGRGVVQVWIDGTEPRATDDAPPGEKPRIFQTEEGARRWLAREMPGLAPAREREISVVILDFNAGKRPAEIRAELKHRIEREAEHAQALERQYQETREELEERRRAADLH